MGQLEIFLEVDPSKRRGSPLFRARRRAPGPEHRLLFPLRFRAISEDFYKRARLAVVYPALTASAPGAQGLRRPSPAQVDIWFYLPFYLSK